MDKEFMISTKLPYYFSKVVDTKYSYVVFLYLVKIASLYTEFGAFQLKWNRFLTSMD
jgi:hypothetical protein